MNSILTADKHHSFIFLDYEGQDHLLSIQAIRELVLQLKNNLVLTVAVRALEFQNGTDLWRSYLDLLDDCSNLSLNIVAGHPAYNLNQTVLLKTAFQKFFSQIRKRTNRPIFFGIDNISSSLIKNVCQQYSPIIPFGLNGDARLKNGFSKDYENYSLAVYAPLATTIQKIDSSLDELLPYLLRRKSIQDQLRCTEEWNPEQSYTSWSTAPEKVQKVIKKNLNDYILTDSNIETKISEYKSQNIKLVVGYPSISSISDQQIEEFIIS